jgi:hypothetical protein
VRFSPFIRYPLKWLWVLTKSVKITCLPVNICLLARERKMAYNRELIMIVFDNLANLQTGKDALWGPIGS